MPSERKKNEATKAKKEGRQGSKLKKMCGRKFATSYENLVATLKMLVAKLIKAIQSRNK